MKRFYIGERIEVKDRRSSLLGQLGTVVQLVQGDEHIEGWIEMDGDLPADVRVVAPHGPQSRWTLLRPNQCSPTREPSQDTARVVLVEPADYEVPMCERSYARWLRLQALIAKSDGDHWVPALHVDQCPGLAVTMALFGIFNVTHLASGHSLNVARGRVDVALLNLVRFSLIGREYDVDWEQSIGDVTTAFRLAKPRMVPWYCIGDLTVDGWYEPTLSGGLHDWPVDLPESRSPYAAAYALWRERLAAPSLLMDDAAADTSRANQTGSTYLATVDAAVRT